MENKISGSSSPVTGSRLRDLNIDSGSRGDHGGETLKTCSLMYIRDKHNYSLNKSARDINVLFLL
jgi:hypothetical protein